MHAIKEIVGHTASFHHDTHEDERRNRHQNEVLSGLKPDARHEIEELDQGEHIEEVPDDAKCKREPPEDERDWKPGKKQDGQGYKHRHRQIVPHEPDQIFLRIRGHPKNTGIDNPDDHQEYDNGRQALAAGYSVQNGLHIPLEIFGYKFCFKKLPEPQKGLRRL